MAQRPPGRPRGWAAAAVLGVALVLAACSSNSGAPATSTKANPSSASAITIQSFAFSPKTVTVAPGTTVTVTNKDQVAHTVTSASGGFNTGDIDAGASKTFKAPSKPGRYPYICSIHQFMMGTLVVSG
jgi:plastocyanin